MNIPQIDAPTTGWINGKPTSPCRQITPQTGKRMLADGCAFFGRFNWNFTKVVGVRDVG